MIRGPVASSAADPSGAGREAGLRTREAKTSVAGSRASWPSPQARLRMDGFGSFRPAPPLAVWSLASGPRHSGPRTVLDNTLERWWRRNRTFNSQVRSLMLYPLSYPWSRPRESNPSPPDCLRRSATELCPRPDLRSGSVHRSAVPSARAERTERSELQPLSSLRHRDREGGNTFCGVLSQAAFWWPNPGVFQHGFQTRCQLKMMRPRMRMPSPSARTITASPSRAGPPVNAWIVSWCVTITMLPEPE